MKELIVKIHSFASESYIFPVIEFAMVMFVIMITYLIVHKMFYGGKTHVKFIFSTILAILGYSMAKLIIFVWIINPVITDISRRSIFY